MSTDLAIQSTEIAPTNTLFGTDNPGEVVARAATVAKTLADLVRRQNLVVRIGQSDHVRVEGWTLLGSMLGVFPVVEWTRPVLENDEQVGWEARVEARTRSGEIVGAAEAECMRSERTWKGRDDYALRSMAQTRAVSKALRLPLGFVMQLAGFDPTPAEEMPTVVEGRAAAAPPSDPLTDVPFGDDPAPYLPPPITEAQKKKLNVLIGRLRGEQLTTEHLYRAVKREPVLSDDGLLHFGPLRDSLTKLEASELIDRLETYEKNQAAA